MGSPSQNIGQSPLQLKEDWFLRKNNIRLSSNANNKKKERKAVSQVSTYVALAHQTSPQHKTLKKPETEAPQKPQITSRKSLHFTTRNTKIVSKKSKILFRSSLFLMLGRNASCGNVQQLYSQRRRGLQGWVQVTCPNLFDRP